MSCQRPNALAYSQSHGRHDHAARPTAAGHALPIYAESQNEIKRRIYPCPIFPWASVTQLLRDFPINTDKFTKILLPSRCRGYSIGSRQFSTTLVSPLCSIHHYIDEVLSLRPGREVREAGVPRLGQLRKDYSAPHAKGRPIRTALPDISSKYADFVLLCIG